MKVNPFCSFLKTNRYLIFGRLNFPKDRIGEVLTMDDGEKFKIFRQVIIRKGRKEWGEPGAVFKVKFHVATMSQKMNKRFSVLPIPFFIGLPGFRSKLWLVNEKSGYNMGIYEWQTPKDAKNYSKSFAMKFMTKRSVPGSASFEIIEKGSKKNEKRQ